MKRFSQVEPLEDRRLLIATWDELPEPIRIEQIDEHVQRFHYEEGSWDLIVDGVPLRANQEMGVENFGAPLAAAIDPSSIPVLHSLSDATAKIFLDFDGNFESQWGGNQDVITPPYDLDGVPESFNSDELARIEEIWTRVSEDYSPFNIDVTTEEPSDATTILQQIDTTNFRTRTFYFRHTFDVANVADIEGLVVSLQRDDGAAVYLNGIEVVRDNLPEDADYRTLASGNVSGGEEDRFYQFEVEPNGLREGRNVIAVEVHQQSDSSQDVSFDLSLLGVVAGQNVTLVPDQSTWSYLDDGSDQGIIWKEFGFNDATWKTESAQFGYGEGDESTVLETVRSNSNRTRTYYFRHEFQIEDRLAVENLESFLLRDDGAAVYLNGTEIDRDNLSRNARFDDFATGTVSGNGENQFYRAEIDEGLLRTGRNVISVEVHQASDASGDVSFDFRLLGTINGTDNQQIIRQGSDWKYLDDGTDQGILWKGWAFDDSAWLTGTAQFGYGDAPGTVHVAIGGSGSDWFGNGAGGVAFVDSFDLTSRAVAFVFSQSLGNSAKSVSEAAAHEAGHTFGLFHQSRYDGNGELLDEYHPGTGNWGPLMGVAYSRELSTWHNGTTSSADTLQDDMSVIARNANGFGYKTDDHAGSAANATQLSLENSAFEATGIIERNTDLDAFSITLVEGQDAISIEVSGIEIGTNLNAILELLDANNEVVATSDPTDSFGANIAMQLTPGTYTAIIRSNGDYGRVGQYTISGRVDEPMSVVDGFARVAPYGSLMMRTSKSGQIHFVNDTDLFQVKLQQGQTVNATIRPVSESATLTASWLGADSEVIANRPGAVIHLPLYRFDGTETTALQISGDETTEYLIEFGVNYANESGETNLNDSALSIESGTRYAAVGNTEDGINEPRTVISAGAEWKYLDDGSNQGSLWRGPGFDDLQWPIDRAEFGYGDDGLATNLSEVGGDGERTRTFYFRKTFEFEDIRVLEDLVIGLKYDDGAAVYLNGTEVVRTNLSDEASYRTFANEPKNVEDVFEEFRVDPDLIQSGDNVLAVEIHQRSDDSSDVRFDLWLDAILLRNDVDEFTVAFDELHVGSSIDIILSGENDFSNDSLQLIGPDGNTVLQTAVPVESNEIDLLISGAIITQPGTYRVRFDSNTRGEYGLLVNHNLQLEVERLTSSLTAGSLGIGFLEQDDFSDAFKIEVGSQPLTLTADYPFAGEGQSTANDLRVEFILLSLDGKVLAESMNGTLQVDERPGSYQLQVLRNSGAGEYTVSVLAREGARDLNNDGEVNLADIDHLCGEIRSERSSLDLNQDGRVDLDDMAIYVQVDLGTNFGDVNLDGVFNSTDLVTVFQAGEYEDGIDGNSSWREGDFNCSGDFDTTDLVVAFQTGSYSAQSIDGTALIAAAILDEENESPEQARSFVVTSTR